MTTKSQTERKKEKAYCQWCGHNDDRDHTKCESKNIVCVNTDGHLVFLNDGSKNWVQIYNKKLREALANIYNLEEWIDL